MPANHAAPPAGAVCACAHCGLPVPPALLTEGAPAQFCCAGCDAAWHIIHVHGLDDFYRLRAQTGTPEKAGNTFGRYGAWDDPAFRAAHAQATGDGCLRADLVVEGIHCAACIWLLEKLPRLDGGVVSARASLHDRTVRVVWDPAQTELSAVARALDALGYPPHPARTGAAKKARSGEERRLLAAVGAAGALVGNEMMVSLALYFGDHWHMDDPTRQLLRWVSAVIGLLSLVWPGRAFFRSAWAALRTQTPNLDLPIALGLGIGGISGLVNTWWGVGNLWFDTLGMLVFLLLVGRYFRFRQQRIADESVSLMFSLTPSFAIRLNAGGADEEVPMEALQPGDLLRVRTGERVPADGVVESGVARVNQALLTGESDWIPVFAGSAVLAGSVVEGGAILLRATACGADARAGRLMGEVERAVRQRAPVVEQADRLAGRFVVFVMLAALGTFFFWAWRETPWIATEHAVALLVIACPCALGLATPLTFAASIGACARHDLLVKGAGALQVLAGCGRIVLDKTGTLTMGRPAPVRIVGEPHGQGEALALAAALERRSLHPLAKAAVAAWGHLPGADQDAQEVGETPGAGLCGRIGGHTVRVGSPAFAGVAAPAELAGLTPVAIVVDGVLRAVVGFGDALRPGAQAAIGELKALGWEPEILSGDADSVVARVAQEAGVPQAKGGASPEDKQARVAQLKTEGLVLMVGDGVNDAAALATASAGIAVHGGAEASLAAADVYIATPGLAPLIALLKAARHTAKTLRLAWMVSLTYNLSFITLAACGILRPWMAAVLMPVSSISVILIATLGRPQFNLPSK